MKYLKSFEKIIPFVDDLGLGFKLSDGMLGILISNNEYEEIDMLLHYLKYDKKIEFRLLITNRIILLLFPNEKEVKKLPRDMYKGIYSEDITDHYVPLVSVSGRGVGWFYQDIIDEDNWEEVIINDDNDIKELEEKMKILSTSNKYNL